MRLADKTIEMPLDRESRFCRADDDADLDVAQLRGFGEVRRSDIDPLAVGDHAFRMQAGTKGIDLDEAARIRECIPDHETRRAGGQTSGTQPSGEIALDVGGKRT